MLLDQICILGYENQFSFIKFYFRVRNSTLDYQIFLAIMGYEICILGYQICILNTKSRFCKIEVKGKSKKIGWQQFVKLPFHNFMALSEQHPNNLEQGQCCVIKHVLDICPILGNSPPYRLESYDDLNVRLGIYISISSSMFVCLLVKART